jgi:hypothetical protein
MLAAMVTSFSACEGTEPVGPVNKTDKKGRLIEMSGRIDQVYARKAVPDPGDSPMYFYRLQFSDLGPGTYTIHMCVEKEVDGHVEVFDIAQAPVSEDGAFTLRMPTAVGPEWLDNIPEGMDWLWEMTDWDYVEQDGIPDAIEISNLDAEMCVANLYMECAEDGQRYRLNYGGYYRTPPGYMVTDTSNVSSSGLIFTSAAVKIAGEAEIETYPGHRDYRSFDITTPGGWNWVHYVANGMSGSLTWTTTYPDWAVMSYSVRAIYDDTL